MTPCPHIIIIIIIWVSACWGVTVKGEVCCCLPLLQFAHLFSFFQLYNINYIYPKYDCYICLKYVEEKLHCTTLNKWWADNYKMLLGINIIEQHNINDGQKLMMLGSTIILWLSDHHLYNICCVCVCVCLSVFVSLRLLTCISLFVSVCLFLCVCLFVLVCLCVCLSVCVCLFVCVCSSLFLFVYVRVYVCLSFLRVLFL